MQNNTTKGVITGDIVNSTNMEAKERSWLFTELSKFLLFLDKEYNSKSEAFRGDSFQVLVLEPELALKIAILIKTYIRSLSSVANKPAHLHRSLKILELYDARIAIGIGDVDKLAKKLAISSGVAFTLSGHGLDKLKGKKQFLAISTDDSFNDELETAVVLLDVILSRTTAAQSLVIHKKLLGKTEIEIANELSIMQSAVNQRSVAGSWNAIDVMVKRFEKIYAK
jgi:hypothetical protein